MFRDQITTGVATKKFTSSNVMRVKITEQEMEALLPIERDGGI